MFNKDKKNIKNIKSKPIIRKVAVANGEEINISILDAKYGTYEGKEILLDSELIDLMIKDISKSIYRNTSKYNKLPKSIIISQDKEIDNLSETSTNNSENVKELIEVYDPKYKFENIYLEKKAKEQILAGLSIIENRKKLFEDWGLNSTFSDKRALVFNFYGPPGTGKSMTAEAIASYLGKKVFSVNYAQLESKYVGETPKNIKNVFEKAKKMNAVLVLDEADSFLSKRLKNINQSADYGVNITRSVMLMELERFDGVVIFTTNLLENYDDAFKRRILANIEFCLPDEKGRKIIWKEHIPKEMPVSENINSEYLASEYDNISGADIKDIVLFAAVNSIQNNRNEVTKEDFNISYEYIINRYKNGFKNINIKTSIISEDAYKKETEEMN